MYLVIFLRGDEAFSSHNLMLAFLFQLKNILIERNTHGLEIEANINFKK